MKTLFAFVFWITNQAVDIAEDYREVGYPHGVTYTVTLRPPLFVRRMECDHADPQGHVLAAGYCLGCEQMVD
jgi:hypothetical protein